MNVPLVNKRLLNARPWQACTKRHGKQRGSSVGAYSTSTSRQVSITNVSESEIEEAREHCSNILRYIVPKSEEICNC